MSGSIAGWRLAELAERIDATLVGNPDQLITGLATLQEARPGELSFLANPKYRKFLGSTRASAVILAPDQADAYAGNALLLDNPYNGYALLTAVFARRLKRSAGVHPTAIIGEGVVLGKDVSIAAHAVIEAGSHIGDNCVIGAGCFIGEDSSIGADSIIHPNVSIHHDCHIGARAIIHSGVVIGGDGFGFAPHSGGWTKIHHMAGVRIGDDVELGAGTCVDRGALADTVIGTGVKTDNMVQIAHGVIIGEHTVIAGCTAIAGSTEIGKHCIIAGAVGIVGHVKIADRVTVTAMTLVTKSITEAGSYSSGTPMAPTREWRRQAVRFNQMDEIHQRLKSLEKGDQ